MLVSYQWLSEYVDLEGISAEEVGEALNRSGVEVESIERLDPSISGVKIGYVQSVAPHPQADRLRVCQVDVGEDSLLQIVCGAPNVAQGQKVPVACIGAVLPGIVIRPVKLRGVESNGMICSAEELGLPDKAVSKEKLEGILVLPPNAPIGEDVAEYFGLTDPVLELALTPNRSDCLSMFGVAYEVSAILNRPLSLPPAKELTASSSEVQIDSDCSLYVAQVVHRIQVGPSPQWLQNRLVASGIRPICNVVDITNYVMLETGQPLHAFDYDTISGAPQVRRAKTGEKVETLDGVIRTCDDSMLVVADDRQILALAGVMGGSSSEVTDKTTSILLEAAVFNPARVRRTARALSLRSEASLRFEKGIDVQQTLPALSRAIELLRQLAQGEEGDVFYTSKVMAKESCPVSLSHDYLCQVLGMEMSTSEVSEIFGRLRLPATFHEGVYRVQVPSRRADITLDVDLIEEVARIYGYDRIPDTLAFGHPTRGGLTPEQQLHRQIRHTLCDLGMHEVSTYSLTSILVNEEVESFHKAEAPLPLSTPMNQEHAVLRTHLLPHVMSVAAYNVHQGAKEIRLFEIGNVYIPKGTTLPEEHIELVCLFTGEAAPTLWKTESFDGKDFYVAKGILEALLHRLGKVDVEYQRATLKGFHPGRTAKVVLKDQEVGILSQLHPEVAARHDLPDTVIFQLDLGTLLPMVMSSPSYQELSRYPAVDRDIAVIVEEEFTVGDVKKRIEEVGQELLESVTLFDVYTGEPIEHGKKSLAFHLVYRADDRTLLENEVQKIHQEIMDDLSKTFGATFRS